MRALAVAVFLLLCACSGTNVPAPVAPGLPGGNPTPSPTPFNGHLFVEYGSAGSPLGDGIAAYALPLTPQSSPQFVIQTGAQSIAAFTMDAAGNLYATDDLSILKFSAPLSAASSPVPLITPGPATLPSSVGDVQFDPSGNLWVATANDVREFPAPLTPGENAATILSGGIGTSSIQFDPASAVMYVGPMSPPSGTVPTVRVYAVPPYTAPPKNVTSPFGVPIGFDGNGNAFSYTDGFVAGGTLQPAGLTQIHLPLSSGTQPLAERAFALFTPQSAVTPAAVDGAQTIYAIDKNAGNAVVAFPAPLSGTSQASAVLPCVRVAGGCRTAVGVYVGP